jgi:hypothetical protein
LQQSSQIDFQIARIIAQRFFSRPLAQSARLKLLEQLLPQISEQPLEPPADRGLVNMKNPGYLGERLPIKKTRAEREDSPASW